MTILHDEATGGTRLPTVAEWLALVAGAGSGTPGGATGPDRELVVSLYRAKSAFSGASVGDTISCVQVIDVTSAASTVSVLWRNQATGTDLASAPSASNLELAASTALTDAQLRAAAVAVTSTQLPASLGTKAAAQSFPVTLAADGPMVSAVGAQADTAATSDTGTFSLIALIKRVASSLTSLLTATSCFRPAAPGATVSVAVTASGTSAIALPAGSVIRFSNAGASAYGVAFGDGSMSINYDTAIDILPGTAESITPPTGATHMRLITAAGVTATAKYTGGTGA